jgi:hypothetical protein
VAGSAVLLKFMFVPEILESFRHCPDSKNDPCYPQAPIYKENIRAKREAGYELATPMSEQFNIVSAFEAMGHPPQVFPLK